MSKILELRTKRNTLWEQTKDFLEKNRGENGLVKAEAVEQYNKMAQEVKDLGAEIERLEQQAQIEAQLSAPTSSPVHADPKSGAKKDVKPTATAEYAENFWNMIRNRGHYGEVRNALSVGEDTEGGFTVPMSSRRSWWRHWRRTTSSVAWRPSSAPAPAPARSLSQRILVKPAGSMRARRSRRAIPLSVRLCCLPTSWAL